MLVMPGSKPICKISNVSRIVEARIGLAIPTATTVRKMGTTAVARNCGEVTRDLVARQMNHDPRTSLAHYQATRADRDATSAYNTIKSLRTADSLELASASQPEDDMAQRKHNVRD